MAEHMQVEINTSTISVQFHKFDPSHSLQSWDTAVLKADAGAFREAIRSCLERRRAAIPCGALGEGGLTCSSDD
jgi:hypothetical protein